MIILHYKIGLRIIILTANLIENDWAFKTQGVWISPILKFNNQANDSITNFKSDIIQYLSFYRNPKINYWIEKLKKCDCSKINVYLIGSVPGRHKGDDRSLYGHLKLRKILKTSPYGPKKETVDWNVVAQFSSIGSLGPKPDKWLTSQFLCSLSTVNSDEISFLKPNLQCIYPSVENVRLSLEGYYAGTSLMYQKSTANRQSYLNDYFFQWKAKRSNRNEASPHIKSYCRYSNDLKSISWFCLTSANLSKSAWGELQVKGSQLFIRSYELGVLFLPELIVKKSAFTISNDDDKSTFPLPFDLPLTPYGPNDTPWTMDINYLDREDSHGRVWDIYD
ncbi:Tyrosyl-DNA phosphodiesterase 1 [Sarcoptes scabiei]|uniref:Tyrosyl-DNA phosphodiesterase 1 n=1 Tax=Sarcoptes scabiei TaxID=52283 RepID=A0A834R5Z8_SARSC|nr:Tyrosyl-DNA phosphodiesterase 1 [Sarcoptes scabiei]